MFDPDDLTLCVEQARKGDNRARNLLAARLWRVIWAGARGVAPRSADDVAQERIMDVLEAVLEGTTRDPLSLAFKAGINGAIDLVRGRNRSESHTAKAGDHDEAWHASGTAAGLDGPEQMARRNEALARLVAAIEERAPCVAYVRVLYEVHFLDKPLSVLIAEEYCRRVAAGEPDCHETYLRAQSLIHVQHARGLQWIRMLILEGERDS